MTDNKYELGRGVYIYHSIYNECDCGDYTKITHIEESEYSLIPLVIILTMMAIAFINYLIS